MTVRIPLVAALSCIVASCTLSSPSPQPTVASAPTTVATESADGSKADELHAFFEEVFERDLQRSPIRMTYLGLKQRYDEWTDFSEQRQTEDYELAKADLAHLRRAFDPNALTRQDRISYRLFEYERERAIEQYQWRHHNYPINQMFGLHAMVPAFLSNFHRVDNESDAVAYIKRLETLPQAFAQLQQGLLIREEKGIIPPAFVFPRVIEDCKNILSGAPFDGSDADSAMVADIRRKVMALEGVSDARKQELIEQAKSALESAVKPAYESLLEILHRQATIATTEDGVWKLPDGGDYYEVSLQRVTTTDLSAERIHAIGLSEVARIQEEMRAIKQKVGFAGPLEEFFDFMRTDDRFYYPNTDEGRQAYMDRAMEIVDAMEARLDELFITKPKARMVVKRVEPYREKSAGKAFYNGPAIDGSRPGIYYANLYNMRDMPIYQMEALAFHEGIPGHHMQIAIAQELENLPKFRRFGGYTAYSEGWGLYAEYIGKEMGFYQDPYSDFGRLAMELWRACRLVVDTGIHHKRWTREQAIEYLARNTPNPEGDVVKAIERYIVLPGQATGYKIGMLEILALREEAKAAMGDNFDLRAFHDLLLTTGPVPLKVLRQEIEAWMRNPLRKS